MVARKASSIADVESVGRSCAGDGDGVAGSSKYSSSRNALASCVTNRCGSMNAADSYSNSAFGVTYSSTRKRPPAKDTSKQLVEQQLGLESHIEISNKGSRLLTRTRNAMRWVRGCSRLHEAAIANIWPNLIAQAQYILWRWPILICIHYTYHSSSI